MIGAATGGVAVSITGLGCKVPDRVVSNDELAQYVDTSDEWIRRAHRHPRAADGRRRRRRSPTSRCPACVDALAQAGVEGKDIDLLIVATVTPDMAFPSTGAILADRLGAVDAAAYDLSAGCTGFMYALAQAYGMLAGGLAKRALVVGGDLLSRILDWEDRSTLVLFGDGAGAVVLEAAPEPGFLGFELGADGAGGENLWLPGSGSRIFDEAERHVKMNGREVFKFATRILVQSAEDVLGACGVTIDDVDVYVPHQANMRIIDHATRKLGVPSERVVINVDRYGNTSSGSIPLALADAAADGRLKPGKLVLMTGMGAGLTWGSALIRWTKEMALSHEQDRVLLPGPGLDRGGHGLGHRRGRARGDGRLRARQRARPASTSSACASTAQQEELVDTAVQQPALVATSLAMLAAIRDARHRARLRRRPLGRRVRGARRGRMR